MYFNSDFYPSGPEVIDIMIGGLQLEGKVILEPQAGSGNIVKALQHAGAKEVIACENDPQLLRIAQSLCRVIELDFLDLTSEKISHIDYIISNPPFSKATEHILHAYSIAPAGCQIIALCNSATLSNRYSKSREELGTLIDTYGSTQNLGDCFSTAERKTDVEVTLIRLQKPGESTNEFEGFFMDEDPEEAQVNGLMSYNVVRDLVNRYVKAVQIFDEQLGTAVRLSEMTSGFYGGSLGFQVTRDGQLLARNEFKKGMQRAGWSWIFDKMNLTKHTTKGLREDINKFVEKQTEIPFTMKNIYRMLEIVIATTGQRMDKAILEVFDKVTSYHDDNRYGLPGWKTNSHYLLTKRFIFPNLAQVGYDGKIDANYSGNFEMIEDLIKALCYVTGDNYDDKRTIQDYLDYHYFLNDKEGKPMSSGPYQIKERELSKVIEYQVKRPGSVVLDIQKDWGKWFETDFFRIRCYKKGTMHFEFKSEDIWALFNQRVSKLRGYPLPEKKEQTAYQRKQNGHKETKTAYRPTAQKPVILSTIQI